MRRIGQLLSLLLVLALAGCGGAGAQKGAAPAGGPGPGSAAPAGGSNAPAGGRLKVVTTLNIIGDLAARVAGDRAEVRPLLAPGTDPHVYEPRPQDSVFIAQAHLVFVNGLGLEGWMEKLLRTAGGSRPIVELAGPDMELLPWPEDPKKWDPHLWMNPRNTIRYVEKIRDALVKLDPVGKEAYTANAARLIQEIEELDRWAEQQLNTVPPERRKLVTTHDAYQYFAKRYGWTVLETVWGVSTESEPSAREIAALVDILRTHRVPPFIETTVNPKIMQQVAEQAGVAIGGSLYGDSLGPPGSGADSYVGMMRHNVSTIVKAMRETMQKQGQ